MLERYGLWFAPEGGGAGSSGGGGEGAGEGDEGQGGGEGAPETWDAYLETLPEQAQDLYESHTQGLRSALDSERDQRKDLARQLREATNQLEEGSEIRDQFEQMNQQLEQANRRVAFYESAPPEVADPRLAFLAAQEIDAFDRHGEPDWGMLKEQFPHLFRQSPSRTPPGHGGAGGGNEPPGADMNTLIRRAAGRG